MQLLLAYFFKLRLVLIAILSCLLIVANAFAQSSDVRFPTPVGANEISDSIPARDLGDARLTDYFYTFTGLPGDLLITVESKNLNGDVDVFTAAELRPLLKTTFYAAESASSATKNIYLRKRESLILRVEARTPNDDPGTYKIRFTGSFEPISGAQLAEADKQADSNRESGRANDRKSTRVSSSGARIEAPPEEVAITPTPVATPSPEPEKATKSEGTASERPSRNRRLPPRRTSTKPATETASDTDKSAGTASEQPGTKPAAETNKPTETTTGETSTANATPAGDDARANSESPKRKPTPPRAASSRTARRAPTPKPASRSEHGDRLVIEVKDGTRREFSMSDVRKVTVENGEIVIEANDGFVQRISMATVARMSIGP